MRADEVSLDRIADVQMGYQTRAGVLKDPASPYAILRGVDVDKDKVQFAEAVHFSPDINPTPYLLAGGDVLVLARGRNHTAHLVEEPPANLVASNSFYIVRMRTEGVLPSYIAWWLNTPDVQGYFLRHQGLSTIPFLSKKALGACNLRVPALEIQQRIAQLTKLAQRERMLVEELLRKKETLTREICLKAVLD